jgi:4'-phosphopantetheinyl transferase
LWLVDLPATAAALDVIEAEGPRLSAADERKISASRDPVTRCERRAAHIALRLLIERAFGPAWRGVPYEVTGAGKPVLPGSDGTFSLSHISGLALIGLSRGAIGVDIEREREVRISEERRELIERAALAVGGGAPLPATSRARFLQAWVRLEARAKAEGGGMGMLLTRFGVVRARLGSEAPASASPSEEVPRGLESLGVHDVAAGEGLYAAVALTARQPIPALFHFPATLPALRRLVALGR